MLETNTCGEAYSWTRGEDDNKGILLQVRCESQREGTWGDNMGHVENNLDDDTEGQRTTVKTECY